MKPFLALVAFSALAQATEPRVSEFASAAQVQTQAAASHYRVPVSGALYRASLQRDLADLRLSNADGEFVPFAFVPRAAPDVRPPETLALKLFPLHGDEARGMEGLSLRIERSASGSVVQLHTDAAPAPARRKLLGYLVEVPAGDKAMQAIPFDWDAKEGFTGSVRIEAGEDLRRWSTFVGQAPVIQLSHAGERLERKRVEAIGARPKYLRIAFSGVPGDFVLKSVTAELRSEYAEPARESLTAVGRQDAEKRDEYQFDLGGLYPVDRLRLELPQANTVAPVQFFSRDKADGPWRRVASSIVYRLAREGGESASPALAVGVNQDRYWMVRVDTRSGGLGAGEAKLVASWIPHEIVFAARGAAPFSVLAGNRLAQGSALPLATILPGYREGQPPAAATAILGELRANTQAAAAPGDTVASVRAFAASPDGRKWLLWSVLVAGVLLVGWMATRLMRDLGKEQPPAGPDQRG